MLCAKCGKKRNTAVCHHCGYDHGTEELLFLAGGYSVNPSLSSLDLERALNAIKRLGPDEQREIEESVDRTLLMYSEMHDKTYREQGMDIVNGELVGYFGKDTVVEVPDTVTKIGVRAFANTDVEQVILPKNLRVIENGAFCDCHRLKEILIPEHVVRLGEYVFQNCVSLEMAVINGRMQTIPEACFFCCVNLRNLRLPDTVKVIEKAAFWSCEKLGTLILPRKLERIEEHAFARCSGLRVVDIPDTVISIAPNAFQRTGSKVVVAPDNWSQANRELLERVKRTN